MKLLVLQRRDSKHPDAGDFEYYSQRIFENIASQGNEVVMLVSPIHGAPPREVLNGVTVVRSGENSIPQLNKEFHFDVALENLAGRPPRIEKKTDLPTVVLVHRLWRTAIFRQSISLASLLTWIWEIALPSLYTRSSFISVSPTLVQGLIDLGISRNRIALVYCGSDLIPEDLPPVSQKERFFLWSSSQGYGNGLVAALDAFEVFSRRHPDAGFLLRMTLSGSKLSQLPNEIRRRGLGNRVLVESNATRERKADLMRRAFCLLQTDYQEGWGFSVICAGKYGTTTIAPDFSGYKDCIRDGVTGLLYPRSKGVEGCYQQMERLYEDEKLRENLQANAKRYADCFHWSRTANEILAVLQKTIENP